MEEISAKYRAVKDNDDDDDDDDDDDTPPPPPRDHPRPKQPRGFGQVSVSTHSINLWSKSFDKWLHHRARPSPKKLPFVGEDPPDPTEYMVPSAHRVHTPRQHLDWFSHFSTASGYIHRPWNISNSTMSRRPHICRLIVKCCIAVHSVGLQCFDAAGWVAGRASGQ